MDCEPSRVSLVARWLSASWLVSLGLLVHGSAADADAAERPNILIITADNLGYGDLPCYNADSQIQTPHLDRLASQGARLTGFYTASPTAPSRGPAC